MSNKKRKLSPSVSSRSSVTPAPTTQVGSGSGQSFLPNSSLLSGIPFSAASPTPTPAPEGSSLAGASNSRHNSASATPQPQLQPSASLSERATARPGTIVPGSGDGASCGDECFLWTDLPMNKGGYRYAPCGPSPTISPSTLIPFYRTIPASSPSPAVHLSWLDRSAFLRVSQNALTATTDRGFRSARANVGVREGSWYFEVYIERGAGPAGAGGGTGGDAGNPHVRVGWGRREAILDGPVGLDGYSYAIRDVAGEKVHMSRSSAYGRSFGTGDTIGCLITLPKRPPLDEKMASTHPARIKRKRVPLRWKGQMYFESDEYTPAKEMEAKVDREGKLAKAELEAAKNAAAQATADPLEEKPSGAKTKGKKGATTKNVKKDKHTQGQDLGTEAGRVPVKLPKSSITFFLNGESLGEAFTDLYDFPPLPSIALAIPAANAAGKKTEPQKEVLHDDGTLGYYPMVSCFGKSKVKCNFGPEWAKPPRGLSTLTRPMCDRWDEFRAEEVVQDEKDEAELADLLIKQIRDEEKRRELAAARLQAATQGRKAAKTKAPKKKKLGSETPRTTPAPEVPESVQNESAAQTPTRHELATDDRVKMEMESRMGSPASARSGAGTPLGGEVQDGRDFEEEGVKSDQEGVAW